MKGITVRELLGVFHSENAYWRLYSRFGSFHLGTVHVSDGDVASRAVSWKPVFMGQRRRGRDGSASCNKTKRVYKYRSVCLSVFWQIQDQDRWLTGGVEPTCAIPSLRHKYLFIASFYVCYCNQLAVGRHVRSNTIAV